MLVLPGERPPVYCCPHLLSVPGGTVGFFYQRIAAGHYSCAAAGDPYIVPTGAGQLIYPTNVPNSTPIQAMIGYVDIGVVY
jgi:hypothetical protein